MRKEMKMEIDGSNRHIISTSYHHVVIIIISSSHHHPLTLVRVPVKKMRAELIMTAKMPIISKMVYQVPMSSADLGCK